MGDYDVCLKVLERVKDKAIGDDLYVLTCHLSGLIYFKELLKGLFKKEILRESVTYRSGLVTLYP